MMRKVRTVRSSLRQRAWWILRNRHEATLNSLMTVLNEANFKDVASNLGKYLRALEKAGILQRAVDREKGIALTSNDFIRYLLKIDCGMQAPIWREPAGEVFDPNNNISYSTQKAKND